VVQALGAVSGLYSEINFHNSSSAGEKTILYQSGAPLDDNTLILFHDTSSAGSAKTLGLVDFVIRPHFEADYFPQATLENVAKWAAKVDYPLYALDDQSALKVIDGKVDVISRGQWKLFGKP